MTRVQPDTLAKIDTYIAQQKEEISRPEAVRRLVELRLKTGAEMSAMQHSIRLQVMMTREEIKGRRRLAISNVACPLVRRPCVN